MTNLNINDADLAETVDTLKTRVIDQATKEYNSKRNSRYYNVSGIPVIIFDNYVTISKRDIVKNIPLSSFIDILQTLNVTDVGDNKRVILPENVISISYAKNRMVLECYHPGAKRTITFEHTYGGKPIPYVIPFPNTILKYTLEQDATDTYWKVIEVIYMITPLKKNELPNSIKPNNSNIFLMPFSNFYSHGTMCYGSNSMPTRINQEDLTTLNYYYTVIFSSPFNSDLGIKGVVGYTRPRSFYSFLSTQETFPYNLLK